MIKKKNGRLIIFFSIIILSCLLFFIYYVSANSLLTNNKGKSSLSEAVLPDTASDKVKIKADVSLDKALVYVKQEIIFNEVQNAFQCYIPSKNYAKTVIKKISADGGISGFSMNGTNLLIDMPSPQDRIYIEYEILLESGNNILSYSEDKILLANFLITAAVKNGKEYINTYTSSFGDPFLYDISNYNITVKTKKDYTAYGGGKISEKNDGGNKFTRFAVNNYRDFSLIICKSQNVIVEKYNNINITYIDSYVSKAYVENAILFAQLKFCKYPYNDLIVASVNMNNSGMEFSGMIFINQNAFKDLSSLKPLIYHEVFHMWFYGVIGVNQLSEPYLDEGLVTFFAAYLTNSLGKYTPYDDKFFKMQLSDYSNKAQYMNFAYTNASKFIHKLYLDFGEDEFFKRIKKMFDERSFELVNFNQFINYFN